MSPPQKKKKKNKYISQPAFSQKLGQIFMVNLINPQQFQYDKFHSRNNPQLSGQKKKKKEIMILVIRLQYSEMYILLRGPHNISRESRTAK